MTNPDRDTASVATVCPVCGVTFAGSPAWHERQRTYCSTQCQRTASMRRQRARARAAIS